MVIMAFRRLKAPYLKFLYCEMRVRRQRVIVVCFAWEREALFQRGVDEESVVVVRAKAEAVFIGEAIQVVHERCIVGVQITALEGENERLACAVEIFAMVKARSHVSSEDVVIFITNNH